MLTCITHKNPINGLVKVKSAQDLATMWLAIMH